MSAAVEVDPAKLDALFEPHNRSDRPGLVVGVAHRGVPVYRRGFGLASVELPVVLSPTMRLRIGSATKHFTCLLVMLLAEEGKLSPQDSVRRHIPELADWAEPVTLAALMSHTGGVRCSLDVLASTADIMSRPLAHAEQLKLLVGLRSVNFAPGETWMYSNGGYVLLTEVVARVSGVPFEEALKTRILDPVGMRDSLARPVDTDALPNSATCHVPRPDGGFDKGVFGPAIGGEGSIVSTVDDMLRWLAHMAAPVVGSARTWAAMKTPAMLTNGRSTGYGLGLAVGAHRGVRIVHHSGSVIGGGCQMLKVEDHELDVIVITNVGGLGATAIVESVIDACITGLDPAPVLEKEGDFPTGGFFSRATGRYIRLAQHEGGPAFDTGSAKFPLPRRADGALWFPANLDTGVALHAAEGGGVDWVEFETADPLAPVFPPDRDATADILGAYAGEDIPIRATVEAGDTPRLRLHGPFGNAGYAMEPAGPDLWLLTHARWGAGPTLERDGDDLLFSSIRARRLRFRRTSDGPDAAASTAS